MKALGIIEYDGTNFLGFQSQKKGRTVEGCLEKALEILFDEPVNIHGAGRTDTGVHARGQTFSFSLPSKRDLQDLLLSLNRLLPKDIHVVSLKEVPESFDARHSAKGKHYSYSLHYGERDPFAKFEWQLEVPGFDPDLFKKAILLMEGKHDFSSFTTKGEDPHSFVRTIWKIVIKEKEEHIRVDLYGDGFMRYMVRIMVGTAVKCAYGKISLEEVASALSNKKRKPFSYLADPCGLVLEEVYYEEVPF